MARMKKDETGHEKAVAKWRQTMLERYGGEDGVKKMMIENGRRGGKATGIKKGFAANPALASIAGRIGGRKSRRTGVKNGEGRKVNEDINEIETVLEDESGRNKRNTR